MTKTFTFSRAPLTPMRLRSSQEKCPAFVLVNTESEEDSSCQKLHQANCLCQSYLKRIKLLCFWPSCYYCYVGWKESLKEQVQEVIPLSPFTRPLPKRQTGPSLSPPSPPDSSCLVSSSLDCHSGGALKKSSLDYPVTTWAGPPSLLQFSLTPQATVKWAGALLRLFEI